MKIADIELGEKPLLLAPMEDVTDPSFRYMCKRFGADVVYTEFISSDGLIRDAAKSLKKLEIDDAERPVGIQLYGHLVEPMVEAARMAEAAGPDIIDINFGCPVKKIAGRGAGSGMMRDVPLMVEMTRRIVEAVGKPVTVKTRLGWDDESKNIEEIALRLQDVGIAALTIHGRTRAQMYRGEADWTLIGKVKNNPQIQIPIIGNGDVDSGPKAAEMFDRYGVDGVMIGRATYGRPWIFREVKHYLATGEVLPQPSVCERVEIAKEHLLPKERQAHGLTASSLRVDESAIRAAIALYTRESGVRSLERQLGKICRKAAMQLATSDVKRVTVTEKNIKDFLGTPRAAQEKIPEKDLVGVVNGLAWTEVGGEILPVEVGVMDGSGKVELTGNLGDVMQESCRAALSCLRQRAQELGIAPDFYKTKDIHIHFPEGAIPKDGPSAGIAIATAVLSALTGQAVHRDVAMTGEITLRGRVLAIGGLREKTMGALRAGVHTVILPKENEKDLDEIDPLVREKLRFVPVETVDAVFAEALVLPEKCTAAAHESYLPPVQESAHSALRAGEMS